MPTMASGSSMVNETALLPKGIHTIVTEIKKNKTNLNFSKKVTMRAFVRVSVDEQGCRSTQQFDTFAELRSHKR